MHITRRLLHAASTSSVNASEVAFFSRLSQQWWDETGEFALLHRMNPVRVQFIRDKITATLQDDVGDWRKADEVVKRNGAKVLSGISVLDVGCGGGLLCESLSRLGGKVLGIDASSSNIAIASTHASRDPGFSSDTLEYSHTTSEDLLSSSVTPSPQFDVVTAMEVVEHVNNPRDFLKSCASLVKPGGHLFLSTIARTPLSHFLTITMAESVLRLVSKGTHSYEKYINPDEVLGFFRDDLNWTSGRKPETLPFDQAEFRGMMYLPWQGKWILAPRGTPGELACNYVFWARKPKA